MCQKCTTPKNVPAIETLHSEVNSLRVREIPLHTKEADLKVAPTSSDAAEF